MRDDLQRRFLARHSVATLFEWLQHCSSIATLCCAKNRHCESSRVTSPLRESSFNVTRGGGDEDIETGSLKF